MTWANMVTEVTATDMPECTAREVVWPWHELDYAVLEAEADRILADAHTPQAVVLLARVATALAGPRRPSRSASGSWTVSAPPAPQIRATQRSPPRIGNTSGKNTFRVE
jgi:hypothetical protein